MKKKMAVFHEVVHSECDYDEDEGGLPEDKHWFSDCSLEIFKSASDSRAVTGFRPWYSTSSFRGSDDKRIQGPLYNDGGRPVIGNYLLPKKFSYKMCFRTDIFAADPAGSTFTGSVFNVISFRFVCMLVWLYPPTSSNQDDEMEFFDNFYQVYDGVSRMHTFLKPEVKTQVRILYDAIHTISSDKMVTRNQWGVTTAAAGGQAGYVVPAPSGTLGWVVPAATVPAIATANSTPILRDVYGGQQVEVQECIDLEGLNVSTWRDPVGEEENQMVPYMQMFFVTDEAFAFHSVNNPNRLWSMNVQGQTCMTFTDE